MLKNHIVGYIDFITIYNFIFVNGIHNACFEWSKCYLVKYINFIRAYKFSVANGIHEAILKQENI